MRLLFPIFALLIGLSSMPAQASPTYVSLQWGLRSIHAKQAWAIDRDRGASQNVCVIDTGIDQNHPDLAGSVLAGTNTANPLTPNNYADDQSHGTHVAGIIAGRGHEISGVAPRAHLLIAKVLGADGSGSDGSVTAGMFWCQAHGAQTVNLSLGGDAASYDGFALAVGFLCRQNVSVVVAAGNSGDSTAQDPASVRSPCLVAVGAEDEDGALASYSSYGQNPRELIAPGTNILSAWVGGGVGVDSGTSMAAPMTAGCVTLLRDMGVNAQGAIADVLLTAHRNRGETHLAYGFGRLDCGAALRLASQEGYGR